MTPPLGFLTLTPILGPNANELLPITVFTFIAITPENMSLTHRASPSGNPDPMISPDFIKANYVVLKSLLRERQKQIHIEELRIKLEYFSEEYDEEMELEPWHVCIRETTLVLRTRLKKPSHVGSYDGKRDPDNYLHLFEDAIRMEKCSIINYEDLKEKLRSHFSQQKKSTKTHLAVHNIKQREGESTRAFVTRYTDDTLQILGLHKEQHNSGFVHGVRTRSLEEFLFTDLPTTYKGLMKMTYTWIEAREVTTNGALNDHREGSDKFKKNSSWDNNKGKGNREKLSLYHWANHGLLSNLSKSPREISATEKRMGIVVSVIYGAIKFHTPRGNGTLFLTYEPNKIKEGHKKLKEASHEATKGILRCVDAEERIVVNEKYLDQTIVIRKQLPTRKCSFGVKEGPFLGHLITKQGIKANPSNVKEISNLHSPKTVKEIQNLNEKLATLSRFLSKGSRQDPSLLENTKDMHEQENSSMNNRARRGIPNNEGARRDIANVENKEMEAKKTTNAELKPENTWKLYTDGASSFNGFEAGLILVSPDGKEYTYALRFKFKPTNNKAEYEALLAGLRIIVEMNIQDLDVFVDSQLVANQVKGLFKARQPVINQ
nr:reverse transcriptase domain-containing protein [Tanacetum cinerariifolium]